MISMQNPTAARESDHDAGIDLGGGLVDQRDPLERFEGRLAVERGVAAERGVVGERVDDADTGPDPGGRRQALDGPIRQDHVGVEQQQVAVDDPGQRPVDGADEAEIAVVDD